MLVPTIVLLFLFSYMPIYGVLTAFQDYKIGNAIISDNTIWVGLKHFKSFFNSIYFSRVFLNTIRLSFENILFGFWVPIVFALLFNEIRVAAFKKTAQTLVYLPYFVSTVVVVAMLMSLAGSDGAIVKLISLFKPGFNVDMMRDGKYFDLLYIGSNIWQTFGYSSIIYIASMAAIDPALYEAATVDGGNRFHKMIHITLPGILPTIMILLILAVGSVLASNTEKILLMLNPQNTDIGDVIGTYVYKSGLANAKYSYSAAVGLLTNVVNFGLVFGANLVSRRATGQSLW